MAQEDDSIKRKPEHVQRARAILAGDYQDALAIVAELIAEEDEWQEAMCREWSKGFAAGRTNSEKK